MKVTLRTLSSATEQQVFDQVAKHLLQQMLPSEDTYSGTRKYRGDNGRSCAAGCLMDDLEYVDRWEDYTWEQLVVRKEVPSAHSNLIQQLQYIHDNYCVSDWKYQLMCLAHTENLTFKFH